MFQGADTIMMAGVYSSLFVTSSGIVAGAVGLGIIAVGAVSSITGIADFSAKKGVRILHSGILLFLGGIVALLLAQGSPILALIVSILVILWVGKSYT